MATRVELLESLRRRYAACSWSEKSRILDEFVAVTGYHRKHAIRLLREPAARSTRKVARAIYGPLVRDALAVLWETSDRVCSKRLKVMIPLLLPPLERHGSGDR